MHYMFPKSHPATSQKVLELLSLHQPWKENGRVLDLGAGDGYFTSLLHEFLSNVMEDRIRERIFACDLFPQQYEFDKVSCDYCDFNASFPYDSESFMAVCSIEVLEHLENVFHFAREIHRILRPGGVAILTTPNVLNLNSRLKAFVTGFPILFDPLPLRSHDPVGGHINMVSFYYLAYILEQAGFRDLKIHTDRHKVSAKVLSYMLKAPIKIGEKFVFRKMRKDNRSIFDDNLNYLKQINSNSLLLGRTLIVEARKQGIAAKQ